MLLHITYPTLRLFLDGMLLMMTLYAFATFIWHHKLLYAWYGLYLLGMIANLYFNDKAHQLQDQHAPESAVALAQWLEVSIQTVAFIFYIHFARTLLNLRRRDPFSFRLTNYMLFVLATGQLIDSGGLWLGSSAVVTEWRSLLTDLNRYVMAGLTFMIVPRMLRLRDVVSSFFIAGTAFFVGGSILAVTLNLFGFAARIPEQPFSYPLTVMQLGIIIESLLFTIAISFLNRQTEREKIQYQAQLIEQLRENEAKQARLNNLRDEIARDLHDEMGSQLSSISILSQTTTRYVDDERARHRLVIIGQTARQVMDSMREIVWSLNSASDSLQDVGQRIRETATILFEDSPVRLHVSLTADEQPLNLSHRHRRELFLIAKECLTNILRHANAQTVWISLKREPTGLVLRIQDNGRGFDSDRPSSGLGLSNLRLRAERLGATLHIESEPGQGTYVEVVWAACVGANLPVNQSVHPSKAPPIAVVV
ncbi:sensor histidine kinase [Spirosoma montaniterrae]|uniref:histidine kinase n=1 Tax=Spirosoma montaniterrae TaxID=1178516 RepID=A0A1P9WU73_9BACT|nr:sensor histidine kinase [Spirosoma montaniterrae]AQG78880.1 hypothetical protein AWR27_05800 [Spirosoma montaniterrae]